MAIEKPWIRVSLDCDVREGFFFRNNPQEFQSVAPHFDEITLAIFGEDLQ
jgi:hypothetical protein